MKRAPVLKTYKLYIGGQFVRSESGHYFPLKSVKGKILANIARASRKDLRDSVQAARKAWGPWSSKTAFNRGQILYRMAEMMEGRELELAQSIVDVTGATLAQAKTEVQASIDRMVWYAGWADKFQQIFGSINPVGLPYFNFTMPESTGVVGILASDELSLLPLVSQMAPVIVSGNTAVVLVSEKNPLTGLLFAEILQTSDVPSGVVTILAGVKSEVVPYLADHKDVNALFYVGQNTDLRNQLQEKGIGNLKRVITSSTPRDSAWFKDSSQSPYWIEDFVEMKTTWHPVGV